MDKKIGFIGCGNMAQAMISALVKSKLIESNQIIVSNRSKNILEKMNKEYGITIASNNIEVAEKCDIVFLAVKPNLYEMVMKEIKDSKTKEKIFVSIAPGKTMEFLESHLGADAKILRTMPNTPSMVSEGMTAICPNQNINSEELELLVKLIESFGAVEIIEEKLFDAVVAVSGSSPAYVFMFIEAMADAAVIQGMPRAQAYRFAAQAVLGSAKMVLESKSHPGELKDMVCSPGGTTIEAVAVLEEKGMRSAVIEAMRKCAQKSKGM
ncbi:pyrroline-5-carboxylate reductase [Acetoanaerobium noterae]|uniref:pyrroline-5-carboxylate reductase n=1 Tax=Acetoanaerobium noterae TaxID=745369 RepID=UPI00333FB1A4